MPELVFQIQRKQIVVVILLILSGLLLLAGDLSITSTLEDDSYLTPIPEKTRRAYNVRTPITNKLQAAIAGQALVNTGHFNFISTPIVRSVEEMTLAEARKRLADTSADDRPPDTKVWLVVMQGDVQIIPPPSPYYQTMTPTPWIIRDSCGFVVLEAQAPTHYLRVGGGICP